MLRRDRGYNGQGILKMKLPGKEDHGCSEGGHSEGWGQGGMEAADPLWRPQ